MIVGTAGHVDHGKTTLVRALTGVDTDRLPEEKARGISIELGYAYTAGADGETLGFIDVPGHERLVRTMIAGACGVDFALLVVAADDGVMPQTREHVAILDLLGIRQGAVALTKVDRAPEARRCGVVQAVETLLTPTALRGSPLFAVDARGADHPGVIALRRHLIEASGRNLPRSDAGLFRMSIDRVFSLPGVGTIAAGTVSAGRIAVGDSVQVMPRGVAVRIRSIHAQNHAADSARAGQRCAVSLAGIDKSQLMRGDWLADPLALVPTSRLDVQLRWLDAATAPAYGTPWHIHIGTSHRIAHAIALDEDSRSGGRIIRAQLAFAAPLCAAAGDPLIVRDTQARHTVGGGRVIDPYATARRRRSPARLAHLDAMQGLLSGAGLGALLDSSSNGRSMEELVRLTGRAATHIEWPPGTLKVEMPAGSFVILDAHWRALRQRTLHRVRDFHARHADEQGVDHGRLRRMTAPALSPILWRGLIDEMLADGALERSEHWLHLPEHRVTLSPAEETLASQLAAALAAGGFDPPWVRDLAQRFQVDSDEVRLVLRKYAVKGTVNQIVKDLFYHRDNIRLLARALRALYEDGGSVQSTQFRDAVGLGRKRSIQVLEFFDRVGYTRRTPQGRIVRTDSSWL